MTFPVINQQHDAKASFGPNILTRKLFPALYPNVPNVKHDAEASFPHNILTGEETSRLYQRLNFEFTKTSQ